MAREAKAPRLHEELRRELREEVRNEVREEVLEELRAEREREFRGDHYEDRRRRDGFFSGASTAGAVGTGAATAAALLLLADNREKLRPLVVGGLKEFYRLRDWLGTQYHSVREDLSDMSAEARAEYDRELAKHMESLDKERELVQRLQDLSKRRKEEGH